MGADLADIRKLPSDARAFLLALSVLVDRLQRLGREDRDDVFELILSLRDAEGAEIEATIDAILEIMEQAPMQIETLSLHESDASRPPKLTKWTTWISGRIRDARKKAGLTQEQLGQKSNLPQSHISRIERGKHSPSRMTLERIAGALGVPLSEFDPSDA